VPALYRIIDDPERQMLGARQEEWIRLEVASSVASGKPWQIFGNQVVMARFQGPDIQRALGGPEKVAAMAATFPPAAARRLQKYATYFSFDIPMDLDGWDGYPAARERMYDAIKASNANAIIVSGDSHAFWVNQLYDKAGTTKVAAEFGVTSVTSPSVGEALPTVDLGKLIMERNHEVLLNNQHAHGYTLLTVTRGAVIGELVSVEKLAKPYSASALARYRVSPAEGPGIGPIQPV
jgi:alkaline phosphatase D